MGKKLFAIYLLVALIVWPFHKNFGDHFDRGYAYNLGESLVWPILLFKSKPTIDASSESSIAISQVRMGERLDASERVALINALARIQFYYLVKNDNSVTQTLEDLSAKDGIFALSSRIQNSSRRQEILSQYHDAIDGETFHGLWVLASDLTEDTGEALKDNRTAAAKYAPVSAPSASAPSAPAPTPIPGNVAASATRVLADDRAATRRGEINIVSSGDAGHEVHLNGRSVFRSEGISLAFKAAYAMDSEDVLLLEDDSGGTACPAQFVFMIVPANGLPSTTPEFGTCSDVPSVTRDRSRIIVRMPGTDGAMHAFTYADGAVQG